MPLQMGSFYIQKNYNIDFDNPYGSYEAAREQN